MLWETYATSCTLVLAQNSRAPVLTSFVWVVHCIEASAAPQVKYASLPNFEEREEDFRAESVLLRRRFTEDGASLIICADHVHACSCAKYGKQLLQSAVGRCAASNSAG